MRAVKLIYSPVYNRERGWIVKALASSIDIVANAVVVGLTPEGIPIVDFTESTVVMSHGNRDSDEEIFAAICASLGPA
jgi:hypothetical protein